MSYSAAHLPIAGPSASMAVSQAAEAPAAEGIEVTGLGEPDFPAPGHTIDAAFAAARSGDR